MIRALKSNQTSIYRDPEAILAKYKLALPLELLDWLRNILYNMNSTKF